MGMKLAALLLPLCASAADWIRITAPQIEIYTDAGAGSARATLDRFEQIRSVFPQPQHDAGGALRVFLFGSEKEFRAYTEDKITAGFYHSGSERDYVALFAGAGVTRAVTHEYIHLLLKHGPAPLPLWFEEGEAELYSNISIGRGGILVGEPQPGHVATLKKEQWLTAAELASITQTSPAYKQQPRAGVFYAESWALVHMLTLAPPWPDHLPRFAELLESGRDGREAFREAFDRSFDDAITELRTYPARMRAQTVQAPAQEARGKEDVHPISLFDSLMLRADLALQVRHADQARGLVEQARRIQPDSAASESALGGLALAQDRRDEARAHFEKAVSMESRDADAYFELAMLERDAGAQPTRIDELLRQAIALNPDFAEARFILGLNASEDGAFETAIEHFKAALNVRPRQSAWWNALAFAQAKAGRNGEARVSALRAAQTANTPEQEKMAEALLGSLQ